MQWSVRNCGRSRIRQMRSMSGTIFERIAKRRFEFVLHMIEHWRPPSDRLRRYPRLLLLCGPIGPVAHAAMATCAVIRSGFQCNTGRTLRSRLVCDRLSRLTAFRWCVQPLFR